MPSERSHAGYRLYTEVDLQRLQQVVVYRRLDFGLEEIAQLLQDEADVAGHLRRQREAITDRIGQLVELTGLIDRALEDSMGEQRYQISSSEMKEIFGESFEDSYQDEAEQRWGDTDAWKESARRTKGYTKEQWEQVKACLLYTSPSPRD